MKRPFRPSVSIDMFIRTNALRSNTPHHRPKFRKSSASYRDTLPPSPHVRKTSSTPFGKRGTMTFVVTENCIKCKYTDCVEVCPVDCFYEGENMLVIHPDECIDCGVCEPECPADAIKPDTEPGLEKWLEVNTEYAKSWPNITQKKESP